MRIGILIVMTMASIYSGSVFAECKGGKQEVSVQTPSGKERTICVSQSAVAGIKNAGIRSGGILSIPTIPDPVETSETFDSLGDLPSELYAVFGDELISYIESNHADPNSIFPVNFVSVTVSYMDGIAIGYVAQYVQMIDPEGGIQLWFTVTLDEDLNITNVIVVI